SATSQRAGPRPLPIARKMSCELEIIQRSDTSTAPSPPQSRLCNTKPREGSTGPPRNTGASSGSSCAISSWSSTAPTVIPPMGSATPIPMAPSSSWLIIAITECSKRGSPMPGSARSSWPVNQVGELSILLSWTCAGSGSSVFETEFNGPGPSASRLVAHRLDHERLFIDQIAPGELLKLGSVRRLDLADRMTAAVEPFGVAGSFGDIIEPVAVFAPRLGHRLDQRPPCTIEQVRVDRRL